MQQLALAVVQQPPPIRCVLRRHRRVVRACCHWHSPLNPARTPCSSTRPHSSLAPPQASAWASPRLRSEEHTSELQSLMRISYAVFCLTKKNTTSPTQPTNIPSMSTTIHI